MHYFIDGYNLLFAVIHSEDTLEKRRETIIQLIQKHLIPLHVEATLVFDSKQEDVEFHDIDSLRIVFTKKGLSADEYIIHELSLLSNPDQETVVTSDKRLAHLAKNYNAHTLSISAFIEKIEKIAKKKGKTPPYLDAFTDSDANIHRLLKIFEKRMNENDDDNL